MEHNEIVFYLPEIQENNWAFTVPKGIKIVVPPKVYEYRNGFSICKFWSLRHEAEKVICRALVTGAPMQEKEFWEMTMVKHD